MNILELGVRSFEVDGLVGIEPDFSGDPPKIYTVKYNDDYTACSVTVTEE